MNYERAVNRLTLEGKFINEYPTTRDAAKDNNISSESITNCCRGRQKSAAGYKWEYNNKYIKDKFPEPIFIEDDEDDENIY
jgi:hypothetical protein